MQRSDSPCDNCAAPCCRMYHVVLNGLDAWRISTTMTVPMYDFCELRWTSTPSGQYRILLSGKPGIEKRYHRLILKKTPDPDPRYTEGRCVFLVMIGERGRCGIFDVRPEVCGIYPTSRHNGIIGLDAGGAYCPPGAWQLGAIDVPLFRLRHLRRDRQRILWDALVDGWNERVIHDELECTERYFYSFVINAYRDLERRDAGLLSDEDATPPEVARLRGLVEDVLRSIGWRSDVVAAP